MFYSFKSVFYGLWTLLPRPKYLKYLRICGSNSSIQNQFVRWGLPKLCKHYISYITNRRETLNMVFPNTPFYHPTFMVKMFSVYVVLSNVTWSSLLSREMLLVVQVLSVFGNLFKRAQNYIWANVRLKFFQWISKHALNQQKF